MSSGFPANAERAVYGELPSPVGPSGSTCHRDMPPARSQSRNANAPGPRSPIPNRDGSDVGCSRMPAERVSVRAATGPHYATRRRPARIAGSRLESALLRRIRVNPATPPGAPSGAAGAAPGTFTDDERALVARFAKAVVDRRMAMPAVLFLESMSPLNFVGASALHFFNPVLSVVFSFQEIERIALFLEKRESVAALVTAIEALEEERTKAK